MARKKLSKEAEERISEAKKEKLAKERKAARKTRIYRIVALVMAASFLVAAVAGAMF